MAFARVYWIRIYDSELWHNLSKSARAVLNVLLNRANANYIAFPSLPMLESDTGYEEKAIHRAIDELKDKKAMEIIQKNGARNRYKLDMWKPENQNDKTE